MPEVAMDLGELISQETETLALSGVVEARRESLRIWSDISGDGAAMV